MNDTTNPIDTLLDTLRARETRLMTDLSDAQRAMAVAIATAEARLEEVRDLMGAITRKKPGRKPKAVETTEQELLPASNEDTLG